MADPYRLTADSSATVDTTAYRADGSRFVAWTFAPASLRNPGTALYEIPIVGAPCTITVDLPGGTFRMRFLYANTEGGGWAFDLADANENPLLCGRTLVPGLDLLAGYEYLGIGGRLFIVNPNDPSAAPGFEDLGSEARLYIEVP